MQRFVLLGLFLVAQSTSTGQCGNSSSSGSTTPLNTMPIVVNAGPTGDSANVAFASVTICVPGQPSSCQTIDNVTVDTGSSGLRLLASAVTLALPPVPSSGSNLVECFPFQDGYTWGSVATADVTLGHKTASSIPVQIIGVAGLPPPPASCTGSGMPAENSLDALGSNGILGIGIYREDCGSGCTFVGASNPALYDTCAGNVCQTAAVPLTQQVLNPIWHFSSDNNGSSIVLPQVNTTGQTTATGQLVFGIGTQSNNGLGSATVITLDLQGQFTTRYGSATVPAFLDSGSNGMYFLDASSARLPLCASLTDFYCPSTSLGLSASNIGTNGRTLNGSFTVSNAETLVRLPDSVLPGLSGPFAGTFDWGLPFFYGRTVFTAIEGQSTSSGTGPFFAY